MSNTISAILATSIILARDSEGDSRNVRRRFFDVTTVNGPCGELRVCFVYRRISDLIRVVLPACAQSCQLSSLPQINELTHPRRTNNRHNHRRRLFRQTVDKRYMETLFFDLNTSSQQSITQRVAKAQRENHTSCDRAACLFNFPGFETAKAFGFDPVNT